MKKKLKLNKLTISNLNSKTMKKVLGGAHTDEPLCTETCVSCEPETCVRCTQGGICEPEETENTCGYPCDTIDFC